MSWLLATKAFTQTYSVDWYKIAGGGGTSMGGSYTVSNTTLEADGVAYAASQGLNEKLESGNRKANSATVGSCEAPAVADVF